MIAGVDEAGKGAVLGPLVVAAVAAQSWDTVAALGARDSKALAPRRREALCTEIVDALPFAVVEVPADAIDAARARETMNAIVAGAHAASLRRLAASGHRIAVAHLDACDVREGRYAATVGRQLGFPCTVVANHHADGLLAVVAVASIVAERVIGLAALCLLAAGVAALFPSFYGRAPELQVLRGFALLLGFGAVAGLGLLFGVDWLRRAEDDAGPDAGWWRRVAGVAVRLYRAMRLCAARPRVLGAAFLLSLVNHLCQVGCAAALGSALGLRLTPADYLAAMPLVNALSAVPLTPGGAGIRETAAVAVLSLAGVPAAGATALSLLLYGVMLAWAAAGGVWYVALRWRASHPATGR